jgi:glycosyltransferase involved in cell wall biosynthesis
MEQKNNGIKLPLIGVKFHGYEMFQKLSSFSQKLKASLLRKSTRWNNENADFVFSYGGKITDLIIERFNISNDQILEFTSGIDNDWIRKETLALNSGKIKFVFVGRDEKRKGLDELNKAINKLIGNVNFEFHFIGPIPSGKKINSSDVFYHGELKTKIELIKVLDSMDVLVCPSHSEGMPNVILEAMARGLAVLATNVGAVEFVVSDENGRVIPPLNQQKLNDSIKEFTVISSENLLKMKLNSLAKVENEYLWSRLANLTIQKIGSLIKKKV